MKAAERIRTADPFITRDSDRSRDPADCGRSGTVRLVGSNQNCRGWDTVRDTDFRSSAVRTAIICSLMDQPEVRGSAHDPELDARVNEAARSETLRRDGQRGLGENLEQAAALISVAFELRDSFSATRR